MMVKLVDHLVQGLHIDIEKRKQDNAEKQRLETQLYKLLTELVETERKYVKDLEKVIFKIHFFSINNECLLMLEVLRVDDASLHHTTTIHVLINFLFTFIVYNF